MNLSALAVREGDLASSLRWADEGVRCNPGLAMTHWYRGAALERLGRLDDALAAYRTTTQIDAVHAGAWEAQARLLEQRGAWDEAVAAYDRASAADPTRVGTRMAAGVVLQHRLRRSPDAVDRFREVLRLDPGHYGAHYQLAVALLGAGRRADAVVAWRRFVPLAERIGDRTSLEQAPRELREEAGG